MGEEEGERRRRHLLLNAENVPARDRAQIAEIAADRVGLVGKALDQPGLVAARVGGDGECEARVEEPLEFVRHPVPPERPAREEIEQAAHERPRLQLAEVMQPDVPGGAVAAEDVRLAAAFRVLLQHQDLHPGDFGEKAGGGQPADSRSDDDRVPSRNHVASPHKFKLLDSLVDKLSPVKGLAHPTRGLGARDAMETSARSLATR